MALRPSDREHIIKEIRRMTEEILRTRPAELQRLHRYLRLLLLLPRKGKR